MRRAMLLMGCLWAMADAAATALPPDALTPIASANLDDVRIASDARLADYRAVIVDPATVAFAGDWLKSMNATRERARWVTPRDAERIASGLAGEMSTTFARVFHEHGYAAATSAGPGVLRLSPHVIDLYLNEVDLKTANDRKAFTRDSAGQATFELEARDSVSGALVARVVDHGNAHQLSHGLNRTDDGSNAFWMNVLFGRWAANCADMLHRSDTHVPAKRR